jgi:hypothetical protein
MKKTILIVGLVVLALGVFGLGVVLAQDIQPPLGRGAMMGGNGGYGPMHDYVEQALADKLGIKEADVEDALASGKSMYQIALDNGVEEADVASVLTEVHRTALDNAVTDGVITREQADFMRQRMTANGFNFGNCPMGNGQGGGYGQGNGYGRGMTLAPGASAGVGGGRWGQQPPTRQP